VATARNRGFTLAEVLVASTLSGFIALVAVGAMKAIADGAQIVNRASETAAEARFAARTLARDLANFYRDPNPENMKLVGVSQGADTGGPAFLAFYTVGWAKARADQPEGDVYEVEYILGTRQEEKTTVEMPAEEGTSMTLFRRLWPNPDKDRDPGGILAPLAEDVTVFQVRFYDGKQWGGEWSEKMKALPELIEITIGVQPPGQREPVLESFVVTFPRLGAVSETAGPEGQTPESGQQPPPEQPGSGNQPSGEQGQSGPPEGDGSGNRGR
jgi:type II secretion system protein J